MGAHRRSFRFEDVAALKDAVDDDLGQIVVVQALGIVGPVPWPHVHECGQYPLGIPAQIEQVVS